MTLLDLYFFSEHLIIAGPVIFGGCLWDWIGNVSKLLFYYKYVEYVTSLCKLPQFHRLIAVQFLSYNRIRSWKINKLSSLRDAYKSKKVYKHQSYHCLYQMNILLWWIIYQECRRWWNEWIKNQKYIYSPLHNTI